MNKNNFCYFGSFDSEYSRNRIIKQGLESNGSMVFFCQSNGLIIKRYLSLTYQFLSQHNKFTKVIVGFPGHYDIFLAYFLGRLLNKEIYYDVFTSTYETYVLDRKVVKNKSIRGKLFYFLDKLGFYFCDYVISDTKSHAEFYKKLYGINKVKFITVYLGTGLGSLKAITHGTKNIDVLFYGSYQPLQGVKIIVKSASMLPGYKFKLIGRGQTRTIAEKYAKELALKNVEFTDWLSLDDLTKKIFSAKVTLGIFGSTKKAKVVIPNKVYDYAAAGKLIITADTIAVKELFSNGKNIVLVPPSDPESLKKAIEYFIKNVRKRDEIADQAKKLIKSKLSAKMLVKPLL